MSTTKVKFEYCVEDDEYVMLVGKGGVYDQAVCFSSEEISPVCKSLNVSKYLGFEIICAMHLLGGLIEDANDGSIPATYTLKNIHSNQFATEFMELLK